REVHRGADEGLAYIVAFGRVIPGFALAGGVAHRGIGRTAIDKAGSQDRTTADDLVVQRLLLVEHVKLVALTDVHRKVDVVAEDFSHVKGQAVAKPGQVGGI